MKKWIARFIVAIPICIGALIIWPITLISAIIFTFFWAIANCGGNE